jgi:23S rRNA (uracil1939-C5)-methyltransferase
VLGIDTDEHAIAEARRFSDAEFIAGAVEDHVSRALPADLVLLNPPRGGLHASVCAALVTTPPARMIYVSCDAATLARDLARIGRTFTLRSVRCFDLFPQTAHIESVAELECATS